MCSKKPIGKVASAPVKPSETLASHPLAAGLCQVTKEAHKGHKLRSADLQSLVEKLVDERLRQRLPQLEAPVSDGQVLPSRLEGLLTQVQSQLDAVQLEMSAIRRAVCADAGSSPHGSLQRRMEDVDKMTALWADRIEDLQLELKGSTPRCRPLLQPLNLWEPSPGGSTVSSKGAAEVSEPEREASVGTPRPFRAEQDSQIEYPGSPLSPGLPMTSTYTFAEGLDVVALDDGDRESISSTITLFSSCSNTPITPEGAAALPAAVPNRP